MPPLNKCLSEFLERRLLMLVRLTRKLANLMDGIDVSRIREGDLIELSDTDATLLIAEGWAKQAGGNGHGALIAPVIPARSGGDDT
jgi:hypothetical protein